MRKKYKKQMKKIKQSFSNISQIIKDKENQENVIELWIMLKKMNVDITKIYTLICEYETKYIFLYEVVKKIVIVDDTDIELDIKKNLLVNEHKNVDNDVKQYLAKYIPESLQNDKYHYKRKNMNKYIKLKKIYKENKQ